MTRAEALAWAYKFLAETSGDPLAFANGAFRWNDPAVGLEGYAGPLAWQARSMGRVKAHLADPATRFMPFQEAISSGHGIGKSGDFGMMILWALMTTPMTRGKITANTMPQLMTTTWPELGRWYHRLIEPLKDMFVLEASSIHVKGAHAKNWRIDAATWSETNTEAFQGLHNKGSRIIVGFDEASAIADKVWEVTEGALTDSGTEILWLVRGNPTRNDRRFRQCFAGGRFAKDWHHEKIDSRNVEITNKAQIAKWLDAYGEDSDFFRVRVRGEFPNASVDQLIAEALVDAARARHPVYSASEAVIWGLDPARNGGDEAVLAKRHGRDGFGLGWKSWRNISSTTLCEQIAIQWQEAKLLDVVPDAIFVDGGGLGGPIIDMLRGMNIPKVYECSFGGAEQEVQLDGGFRMRAFNSGAAMWLKGRDWLATGCLDPNDDELKAQLIARNYYLSNRTNAVQLESKQDIRDMGGASPDRADAWALTFWMPVLPRIVSTSMGRQSNVTSDYDVHADVA